MPPARSGGKRHRIAYAWGVYTLSWSYEVKYQGSRGLFHRTMSRDTDKKGAERFAKKWNTPMPEVASTPTSVSSAPKRQRR